MIARLDALRAHPSVFRHLTGLTVPAFDARAADMAPAVEAAHRRTLDRADRQRAIGAGGAFGLTTTDHVRLTVAWLRRYPTQEVLGLLFGVSDATARRAVRRCLPALERAGPDTMRLPDPGPGRREKLPTLRAGPWADIKLLKKSRLLKRLPEGVGGIGDWAYVGIADLHPDGLGAAPRRKPRGRDRPPEDRKCNRAFRRRRIVVEHAVGRLRRFRSVAHVNRHRRAGHAGRVRAVAGLVNRMLPTPTT